MLGATQPVRRSTELDPEAQGLNCYVTQAARKEDERNSPWRGATTDLYVHRRHSLDAQQAYHAVGRSVKSVEKTFPQRLHGSSLFSGDSTESVT